jgi:hypothetical protein
MIRCEVTEVVEVVCQTAWADWDNESGNIPLERTETFLEAAQLFGPQSIRKHLLSHSFPRLRKIVQKFVTKNKTACLS